MGMRLSHSIMGFYFIKLKLHIKYSEMEIYEQFLVNMCLIKRVYFFMVAKIEKSPSVKVRPRAPAAAAVWVGV